MGIRHLIYAIPSAEIGSRYGSASSWAVLSMRTARRLYRLSFTDVTDIKQLELEQERQQLIENRSLRAAICTAYPLIMSLNLTKDIYNCFIEDQDACLSGRCGSYTEMIRGYSRCVSILSEDFETAFARENVLARFAAGERDIYMEFQKMGMDGKYHWLSVQIIYVENPFNDDVLAIELVKVLDSRGRSRPGRSSCCGMPWHRPRLLTRLNPIFCPE